MPINWRIFKARLVFRLVAICLIALTLISCGGGGGGGSDSSSPSIASKSINGGGVKGPLANAILVVYAFDPTQPGYKGEVIATAVTDSSAAVTGLALPLPLTPPYIMEFTSDAGTTDITTGMAPVIGTLRTVITQALLDTGEQIYATPLTTAALDIAIYNSNVNTTSGQFEAALAIAADQVVSTLGFGMPSDIDIFNLPPLIDDKTVSTAEQSDVAAYRSAIEALTAIVYLMEQQASSGSVETLYIELTRDLADGVIDGIVDGAPSSIITGTVLTVLAQNPANLVIPNTSPVQTVANVQAILVSETAITGITTSTTQLQAGGSITTTTQPAETNSDIDGDTVLNVNDAFPTDPNETVDTDGDGIGNNTDTDDDDDGIDDATENVSGDSPDHDGDGIPNREDTDSDNDSVLDSEDFDPYDNTVTLNNAPVTTNSSVTTDQYVAVAVLLNVTDDGVAPGALTFTITNPPTNGVLSGTAPNLTYIPNAGYSGGDSFNFTATDGGGEVSNVSTVSITVNTGGVPVTEYKYQGPNFSSFSCGGNTTCSTPDPNFTSYSANNSVTATITLDEQLQPNLLLQDVRGLPGFSLTISDGLQVLSSPDEVLLSTNDDGDIVPPWSVISNGPVPPNNGAATIHWAGGRGIQDFGTLGAPTGSTQTTVRDEGYNFSGTGQWTTSGGMPPDVNTVELSPGTVSIGLGFSAQIFASAKDNGGNVIANTAFGWSSSDNNIATVSSSGVVSSVAYGTVIISATAGNGVSGSANITVRQQVASTVQLTPPSLSFSALGDGLQVNAHATDTNGNSIANPATTWSSSNDNIATVSNSGFVTAQGNGSATISALIDGITSDVTVTVQQVVTAVQVNPSSVVFTALGSNQTITAVAFDANNNPVIGETFDWFSSDETISTVDASGIVSSKGNGTATVTATTGGIAAVVAVTVQLTSTVQLTPASLSFSAIGEAQQLVANAFDSNGNPVGNVSFIWSSTDDSVASVTTDGLVTSQGNGTATVSASIAGFAVGSASVTLNQVVASVDIFPNTVGLMVIGSTTQVTAEARDANGHEILSLNASPQNFQWTSSDELTANVVDGQITARDFGGATISATAGGSTGSASISIEFPGDFALLPTDWAMPVAKSVQFVHKLEGSHTAEVEWTVNGIQGGNSEVGTIGPDGIYTAPTTIPTINPVIVRASIVSDPATNAESPVTITLGVDSDQLDWYQLTPSVVTPGSNEPIMFEAKFSGYPQFYFEISDGTRLEPVAFKTGVYAWQFSAEELLHNHRDGLLITQAGVLYNILCNVSGDCFNFSAGGVIIGVLDAKIPPVNVVNFANDVQASSHVINLVTDQPTDMPLSAIAQKVYQYFPDDFDFLARAQPVYSRTTQAVPSYNPVANDVLGIGLAIWNQHAAYGSQGRLKGMINFPTSLGYNGAHWVVLHELGHRWLAFLNKPPILAGPHWPKYSSLSKDIMGNGQFQYTHVSQNVYEIVCPPFDFSRPSNEYSDIELYLMGLLPPDQVQPHVILQDQSNNWSCNSQAIADIVTIDDIVADYGVRNPNHTQSQKDFSMATIHLSLNRLLTEDEMAYYNYHAALGEARVPVKASGSDSLFNPFYLATGGRATLTTRVLP